MSRFSIIITVIATIVSGTFALHNIFSKATSLASNILRRDSSNLPMSLLHTSEFPAVEDLQQMSAGTSTGQFLRQEEALRATGEGLPHTDAKLRLFGTTEEPKITLFRDMAAWCPYCQKVWILLEEKRIPYKVEKINMRSYGDKPEWFLNMVPNGLLPAIKINDNQIMTESLDIMLYLDANHRGGEYGPAMWPSTNSNDPVYRRASTLMRLERDLFGRWCDLVFRPYSERSKALFEEGLSLVDQELAVTDGPWFLQDFSIVDLTYITHIERMCASVAYWCGLKIRGNGRWPHIDRWMAAFEAKPSYIATKSDYYTHIQDIPPQYGRPYPIQNYRQQFGDIIDGKDGRSWSLPLPVLNGIEDVEPVVGDLVVSDTQACEEAAYKLSKNLVNVARFALRGCGKPGRKRFQAPLADPYAEPNLNHYDDMVTLLRMVVFAMLQGNYADLQLPLLSSSTEMMTAENQRLVLSNLASSAAYLRDRIGVPRDMSYPAARQLRAHLNWAIDLLVQAEKKI